LKFLVLFLEDQRVLEVSSVCEDVLNSVGLGLASVVDITDLSQPKEYVKGKWVNVIKA